MKRTSISAETKISTIRELDFLSSYHISLVEKVKHDASWVLKTRTEAGAHSLEEPQKEEKDMGWDLAREEA